MSTYKPAYERLRKWAKGRSQKDLAAELKMAQGTVSKLLSGKYIPSVETAKRLEAVSGVRWSSWFE